MRTVTLAVAIIIALAPAGGAAQELSTDVYPSEDELLEALRRGDIDAERYEILLEILREGIDASSLHLLNEVPNLAGERLGDAAGSRLAAEQAEAFLVRGRTRHGTVEHRYTHEVEREGRGAYRTTISGRLSESVDCSLRLDRTITGRERVAGRMVRYRAERGVIREITVGSMSRRLGLGTVTGYRGKILDSADRLNGESMLFPDYGGQNGGYLLARAGEWQAEGVVSYSRDSMLALSTGAVAIRRKIGRVHIASVMGATRLRKRGTDAAVNDVKYGGWAEYEYRQEQVAVEVTGQAGARSSFGAVVGEGRHRAAGAVIEYAGWHYDREYLDLTGGSRGGSVSVRENVPEVDFLFSSRRTGSTGGMVRTAIPMASRLVLESGLTGSAVSRDTLRGEAMGAVILDATEEVQVRVDHQERITRRRESVNDPDDGLRRTRAEVRYDRKRLAVRSYVGYSSEIERRDYWSMFTRVRIEAGQLGRFEFWGNIGRIDMKRRVIEYGYVYAQCRQGLWRNVESGVKVAHRYSRAASDRHVTTVALEVSVAI